VHRSARCSLLSWTKRDSADSAVTSSSITIRCGARLARCARPIDVAHATRRLRGCTRPRLQLRAQTAPQLHPVAATAGQRGFPTPPDSKAFVAQHLGFHRLVPHPVPDADAGAQPPSFAAAASSTSAPAPLGQPRCVLLRLIPTPTRLSGRSFCCPPGLRLALATGSTGPDEAGRPAPQLLRATEPSSDRMLVAGGRQTCRGNAQPSERRRRSDR
jgi:hypothetical protein